MGMVLTQTWRYYSSVLSAEHRRKGGRNGAERADSSFRWPPMLLPLLMLTRPILPVPCRLGSTQSLLQGRHQAPCARGPPISRQPVRALVTAPPLSPLALARILTPGFALSPSRSAQTGFVLASMFKLFAVGYGRWEDLITQVVSRNIGSPVWIRSSPSAR